MMNLLVVDDDLVIRRVVMFTLKTIGVNVLAAENGTVALQIAEQQDIDLMLVDINLPDMDGFSLMKHLHAMAKLTEVPIIAFTARNSADDELRAQESGAIGFLYKPFSTQELRDLVTKFNLQS